MLSQAGKVARFGRLNAPDAILAHGGAGVNRHDGLLPLNGQIIYIPRRDNGSSHSMIDALRQKNIAQFADALAARRVISGGGI